MSLTVYNTFAESSLVMSKSYLPPELWLHIFRIATTCLACQKLYEFDYVPFHDLPDEVELKMLGNMRSTKSTLVLVCKQWRALAARYFYEDLRVCHGLQGLYDSLNRSIDEVGGGGYGAFVRRIELSVMVLNNPDFGIRIRITLEDILRLCPHAEIMLKDDDDLLHPRVIHACTTFQQLKRFDWWYASHREGVPGVDFLHGVVSRASDLRYLSIRRRSPQPATYDHRFLSLRFPALTTLRIINPTAYLLDAIQNWDFPSLTNLITDESLCRTSLTKLGSHVEVLELISSKGFMESFQEEQLAHLFSGCPDLRELNYRIEYIHPLLESATIHPSVRCIRLHGTINTMLRWYHIFYRRPTQTWAATIWKHYKDHFLWIWRSFPALERIVLHGDWGQIMENSGFRLLTAQIIAKGCALQYDHDNGVVDTLS